MSKQLEQFRMLIGGKAADAISGRTFESENPYTGQPWACHARRGPGGRRRRGAGGPRRAGRRMGRADRVRPVPADAPARRSRLAERRAAGAAGGAGLRQAVPGDDRPARTGWAAGTTTTPGWPTSSEGRQIPAPSPNYLVYTRREPVGVVAAITPWNSPLLLMTWKVAPGAGRGMHRGGEAVGAFAGLHAGLRRADRAGRFPARGRQRRHRAVP